MQKGTLKRSPRRTNEELNQPHVIGSLGIFVRERRHNLGYTQEVLAERTGTSLNFVKSVEMGKKTLRLDKVNQVLALFGASLEPTTKPKGEGIQK
jgi:y4mF family transcriptional regulator